MSQISTEKSVLITTPLPKATSSYSPVPHREAIAMTLEALDKANMTVKSEHYLSARAGRQAIGYYVISSHNDPDMAIRVAWNNSYDKTTTLKWAIGGHVFVCSNGVVSGDMGIFKRRHTGTVLSEYQGAVNLYVNQAGELFERLIKDKERMKEIEVSKKVSSELIGRMFLEEDIITATQIGIIKKELENPSFNYNAAGSLWELYNHVTHSLKEAHPQYHFKQHMDAHQFFTKEFQII